MADKKKGGDKGGAAQGGAPVKKKPSKKLYKLYDNGKLKSKSCPKCGRGYFLAAHKDRLTCGKCGYMEKTSSSSEKKDDKKEDKKK